MLKITRLSDKLAPGKNIGNKLASAKNNSNDKIDKIGGDNVEYAKKSKKLKKLSKLRKSKSEKLYKCKKPSKSGNYHNFGIKKVRPIFLTSDIRMAFNYLWLTFTKA